MRRNSHYKRCTGLVARFSQKDLDCREGVEGSGFAAEDVGTEQNRNEAMALKEGALLIGEPPFRADKEGYGILDTVVLYGGGKGLCLPVINVVEKEGQASVCPPAGRSARSMTPL